jgi:hypothetical protein
MPRHGVEEILTAALLLGGGHTDEGYRRERRQEEIS